MTRRSKRPAHLPLLAWSDAQAARAAGKAQFRRELSWLVAVTGLLLVVSSIIHPPKPVLVWNASPSATVGLYYVDADAPIAPGDMVVAWAPAAARRLAAARHYLPANVPLVKRVAAAEHDVVCGSDDEIIIDGGWNVMRRRTDTQGRPMPRWQGCHVLQGGELFLLMEEHPDSFDGRYFGVSEPDDVIGKATLIWAR